MLASAQNIATHAVTNLKKKIHADDVSMMMNNTDETIPPKP
jgi:hypothetical protein